MGRLIDADLFKQQMSAMALTAPSFFTSKVVKLLEIVDKQPTAFDVEAVVKELEKLPIKTTSKWVENKEVPEYFHEVITGEYINKNDAIDIVRRGGVK